MAPKKFTPTPSAIPPSSTDPSHRISTAASSTYGTTSSSKSQIAPPTTPLKSSTSTSTPSIPNTTSSSSGSGSKKSVTAMNKNDVQNIAQGVWKNYWNSTPQRVKLIDVFMGWLVVVGGLQFVYCVVAGNYPFNAFLSGFSATVGQFVLTASLRIQTNPENRGEFKSISDERAFADYVFGSLLLHFFCVNFIN